MSRSAKKGPYSDLGLLKKVLQQKETGNREPIKTWARASSIPPQFVDHTFLVHNGKAFIKAFITEDMVGHKLGEFSPTRTWRGHAGDKKKKR